MSSSPYVVLGNRSLDKWKVTELKEELKKRRLTTSGLKADLIKRLDEAVRIDWENAKEQNENTSADPSLIDSTTTQEKNNLETSHLDGNMHVVPENEPKFENIEAQIHPADATVGPVPNVGCDLGHTESVPVSDKKEVMFDAVTDDVKLDVDVKHPTVSGFVADGGESCRVDVEEPPEEKLPLDEVSGGGTAAAVEGLQEEDFVDAPEKLGLEENSKDVSVEEKNVLKSSREVEHVSNSVGSNDDLEIPLEKRVELETDGGDIKKDTLEKVDTLDFDPPEKLSIDQSSSDEFMEEDALESKQEEQNGNSCDVKEIMERSTVPEEQVDKFIDNPIGSKVENSENEPVKRKFTEEEAANNEKGKRQRINTADDLNVSEKQRGTDVDSMAHRKLPHLNLRTFSKSDSTVGQEAPKERVVPPSANPPSNSLRIDNFLRPFTLKAVQDLLAKTGTVTNFWMDQIKTHCYVSYSSTEEAVATRSAVYNLQWPPHGGRLLMAEFVDPQEVKTRAETPQSPATPSSTKVPTHSIPQPLLSNQPSIRECANSSRKPMQEKDLVVLGQAQKPPEDVDPPILTLDDLFHKTKATPRIYYLPLSDEQVATKLKAQEKA